MNHQSSNSSSSYRVHPDGVQGAFAAAAAKIPSSSSVTDPAPWMRAPPTADGVVVVAAVVCAYLTAGADAERQEFSGNGVDGAARAGAKGTQSALILPTPSSIRHQLPLRGTSQKCNLTVSDHQLVVHPPHGQGSNYAYTYSTQGKYYM